MKIAISENIRLHRKRMKLTQEQLAEAMSVTVGAVSKWESGLSNPEITLLPELADFFGISVDVLLGYHLYSRTPEQLAEELYQLTQRREYEKGEQEAEKAIKKYPNHFRVIYQSALLFYLSGVEREDGERKLRKALELYKHACTLISQNTLEEVSEQSLQNRIGEVYYCLGEKEQALAHLKKYNACGVNNSMLGLIHAQNGEYKEAFRYFSWNMVDCVGQLLRTVNGMAVCYYKSGDAQTAYEILEWIRTAICGLQADDTVNYMDKVEVMLLCGSAQMSAAMGQWERAENALRRARQLAEGFDASPNYEAKLVKFYRGEQCSLGDDFGETAVQGMEKNISEQEVAPGLKELWEKIKREGGKENEK